MPAGAAHTKPNCKHACNTAAQSPITLSTDSALTAPTAQVIVPSIGSGSGAGLNDWRGWLGFGLSLASMAATVVYFVSLQASRRLGFTSLQLQVGLCHAALRHAVLCHAWPAALCFVVPCVHTAHA